MLAVASEAASIILNSIASFGAARQYCQPPLRLRVRERATTERIRWFSFARARSLFSCKAQREEQTGRITRTPTAA